MWKIIFTKSKSVKAESRERVRHLKRCQNHRRNRRCPTTKCFHNTYLNCTMHLTRSGLPLTGNDQSVFTVQSAGAETSSTNYSKKSCEIIPKCCHLCTTTVTSVRASLWFTLLCSHWLTAVNQTSRKTGTNFILGQSRSKVPQLCSTLYHHLTALMLKACFKNQKGTQRAQTSAKAKCPVSQC